MKTRFITRNFRGEFIYTDQALPDHGIAVLVAVPTADSPVWIARLYNYGWVYEGESDAIELEVVAWAPIPGCPITHEEAKEYENTPALTEAELATLARKQMPNPPPHPNPSSPRSKPLTEVASKNRPFAKKIL